MCRTLQRGPRCRPPVTRVGRPQGQLSAMWMGLCTQCWAEHWMGVCTATLVPQGPTLSFWEEAGRGMVLWNVPCRSPLLAPAVDFGPPTTLTRALWATSGAGMLGAGVRRGHACRQGFPVPPWGVRRAQSHRSAQLSYPAGGCVGLGGSACWWPRPVLGSPLGGPEADCDPEDPVGGSGGPKGQDSPSQAKYRATFSPKYLRTWSRGWYLYHLRQWAQCRNRTCRWLRPLARRPSGGAVKGPWGKGALSRDSRLVWDPPLPALF